MFLVVIYALDAFHNPELLMSASYLLSFLRINIRAITFIPAFYTLYMLDYLSLFSFLNALEASMFLKLIPTYHMVMRKTALLM